MANIEITLNISTLLLTFWKILKTEIIWYWCLGAVQWNYIWESLIHLYLSPWIKVYKAATFISLILEMTTLWEGEKTAKKKKSQLQVVCRHWVVSSQSPWTESQWCLPAGQVAREREWIPQYPSSSLKNLHFLSAPISNLETCKTQDLNSKVLGCSDTNMKRELMHIFIF